MLDSFGSLEDLDKALPMAASGITYSDEVLPPARTLIARANLSHRWDEAAKMIPKARYFWSPFIEFGLADLVRMRMSRFERSLIRLCRGCRRERFCLSPRSHRSRPSTTVGEASDGLREIAAEQKLAADVEIGHESFLFRIDPRNSYVSDEFASADPRFWSSRPKE